MLVTAIPGVARNVGANRVVEGDAIASPLGLTSETPERERQFRRNLVQTALQLLQDKVQPQALTTRTT